MMPTYPIRVRVRRVGQGEGQRGSQGLVVDAHLPHVHLVRELACGGARACEDCGAVAVRVGVDEGDGLVEAVGVEHLQHR